MDKTLDKTVSMSPDKSQTPLSINIYGKPIKQVKELVYLRHKLSSIGNQVTAVKHRMGLEWAAFGNQATILKSKRVQSSNKSVGL